MTTPTYRWNTSEAAEAYDQSAPTIHPYYEAIQQEILDRFPFKPDDTFDLVDLGGGSGRLAERVLRQFDRARVTIVDQSEPFLALAERRLQPFAPRFSIVQRRLQDDWAGNLATAPNMIVSTSAIHHLAPDEKRALFATCFQSLKPGGTFINGDEYRPAGDKEFFALLEKWAVHMQKALNSGRIPESFRKTVDQWRERNIGRFGEPKTSGDDCLETVATQLGYLQNAGFARVETTWAEELWAVLRADKSAS
jgi:cyclopropane fatty-acyl-phospholipid synthase-like methyltransferase